MTTLTIKNLPAEVHTRLKERAARQRRSLNAEVVACLEATVIAERVDPEALLARARSIRAEVGGHLTDTLLADLVEDGRS